MKYKGKVIKLNPKLIIKQKISEEEKDKIIKLHKQRMDIEKELLALVKYPIKNEKLLFKLNEWKICQYSLQLAWKFPLNNNYHKFWLLPGCTCPKIDNEERYPVGYYIRNNTCPYHGEEYELS